jgi:hypothetical protein
MRTVNVGVIGGGFMGKAHSLAYAAMPMFFWPAPAIPRRAMIAGGRRRLALDLVQLVRAQLDLLRGRGLLAGGAGAQHLGLQGGEPLLRLGVHVALGRSAGAGAGGCRPLVL